MKLTLLALLLSANAFAQTVRTFDSDLSSSSPHKLTSGNLIKPDHVVDGKPSSGLAVQFVRMVKGVETPVQGLKFKIMAGDKAALDYESDEKGEVRGASCLDTTYTVSIALDGKLFQVTPGEGAYQLLVSMKCGTREKVVFDESSDSGQAISIWQTLQHAHKKLEAEVGLSFWQNKIPVVWPANGDFYSMGTVHISNGHEWDVVSHELGHAIYDQGKIGVFGSGEHYIDRCYSEELALSEGWASFFAAWLNLDLKDPNAHFEYMVPRRAPLGVENVPSDVCGEPTNEWRVFAFLWDLIDQHDDGETFSRPFAKLWEDTNHVNDGDNGASSIGDLKDRLIQKGWDAQSLNTIWKLNFPGASARF